MKRRYLVLITTMTMAVCFHLNVRAMDSASMILTPNNFSNNLVVAGESQTQTMVISNIGISDLEFSFCSPPLVKIQAFKDTFITEHDGYGGEFSTHGTNTLRLVHAIPGLHRTHPIVSFDLTSLAGKTIRGSTVDFVIYIRSGWGWNHVSQSISVHESLVDWDEMSASYANFGGVGFNRTIHTGSALTTQTVTYNGNTEPVTFKIPSSVVQRWIDDPSSNKGLLLISSTTATCRDMSFWSRETGPAPQLSFELDDGADDDSLIAHYPFNGNANDESGNGHDGVVHGASLAEDRFGNPDSAYILDGVDDYMDIGYLGGIRSVSMWIKQEPRSGFDFYFGHTDFRLFASTAENGRLTMADGTSALYTTVQMDDHVGQWNHIVALSDGTNSKIYFNGIDVTRSSGDLRVAASKIINIGRWPGPSPSATHYLNGLIDDLRLYNRVLSESEILELYNEDWGDGLVAYYPFNGNANDESGNEHSGSVNGATLTMDRFGNPESAYHFDGKDDIIVISDHDAFTLSNMTVAAWIRTMDKSDHQQIISCYGTGYYSEWIDLYYRSASGAAAWQVDPGGINPPTPHVFGTTDVADGKWHLLVGVRDTSTSTLKIFVDGVLENTAPDVSNEELDPEVDFWVGGQNGWPDRYFNGDIDDVRIYNKALSDADVMELFNEGQQEDCNLPDWLAVAPVSGAIEPGSSQSVEIMLDTFGMTAGDHVSHELSLFSNDPKMPVAQVPVTMWVVPSAPVMLAEPTYTAWKSNEVFWAAIDGPVMYFAEAHALEHCSPGRHDEKFIPRGWSNVQRYHDPNRWMQQSDWSLATSFVFTDLRLNTKYQYRVKAAVSSEIGLLESAWSDWVESCQVPHLKHIDENRVPDSWKEKHYGKSENFLGLVDSDGDGLCDFEEFVVAADPFDRESSFKIEECGTCANGHFVLTWDSAPDREYSVYWAPSIADPFQLMESGISFPRNTYTDNVHQVESGGFYKVDVQLAE